MDDYKKLTEEELEKVNGGADGEEISDGIIKGGIYRIDDAETITLYRPFLAHSLHSNSFYTDLAVFRTENGQRIRYISDSYVPLDVLRTARFCGIADVMAFEDTTNIRDLNLI